MGKRKTDSPKKPLKPKKWLTQEGRVKKKLFHCLLAPQAFRLHKKKADLATVFPKGKLTIIALDTEGHSADVDFSV